MGARAEDEKENSIELEHICCGQIMDSVLSWVFNCLASHKWNDDQPARVVTTTHMTTVLSVDLHFLSHSPKLV